MKHGSDLPVTVKLFTLDYFKEESARLELTNIVKWPVGVDIEVRMEVFDVDGFILKNFDWSDPSTFTASWCESREELEECIASRRLPPIKIPKTFEEKGRLLNLFFTIYPDPKAKQWERREHPTLHVAFQIELVNKPISKLKVTYKGLNQNRISADESLEWVTASLALVDEHDNKIGNLDETKIRKFSIESDFVATDKLKIKLNESRDIFVVNGFEWKNERQHKVGKHSVKFTYKSGPKKLSNSMDVDITPGELKQIKPLIENLQGNILDVQRGQELAVKFRLMDQYNNAITTEGLQVALGCKKGLDLKEDLGELPSVAKTNEDGIADFGKAILFLKSVNTLVECPLKKCPSKCYGLIQLGAREVKSSEKGKPIATVVRLHLTCLRDRPRYFDLNFEIAPVMTAGEILSRHSLILRSEDKDVFRADPKRVHLKLSGRKTLISLVITASSDPNTANGLIFVDVIKVADIYDLEIEYLNHDISVNQKMELTLTVNPDKPSKLKPKFRETREIEKPIFVSNSADAESRIILSDVTFEIVDQYDNFIGITSTEEELGLKSCMNGTLIAEMDEEDPDAKIPAYLLPKFHPNASTISFRLAKGKATVQSLVIQEDTNGICGGKYLVRFVPNLQAKSIFVEPYLVHLVFFKDSSKLQEVKALLQIKQQLHDKLVKHQEELNEIEEKRKILVNKMYKFTNFLENLRKDLGLKDSEFERPEQIRMELNRCKDRVRILQEKEAEKPNDLMQEPPLKNDDQNILGRFVHLAKVAKRQDSLLLSWHLKHVMRCIVTRDSIAAQRLVEDQEMVLALDSILPMPEVPALPHLASQDLATYNFSGNIVLARSLFTELSDPAVQQVIDSFLKNTVIIDTRDKALAYRKMLIEKSIQPPLILTRDYNRILENGLYGGSDNRCPKRLETLDAFFLIATNPELLELRKRIGDLKKLERAHEDLKEVREENNDYQSKTSAQCHELRSSCKSLKERIDEAEAKLKQVDSSNRERKRPSDHDGRGDAKRKRLMEDGSLNLGFNPDPTGDDSLFDYSTEVDRVTGEPRRRF